MSSVLGVPSSTKGQQDRPISLIELQLRLTPDWLNQSTKMRHSQHFFLIRISLWITSILRGKAPIKRLWVKCTATRVCLKRFENNFSRKDPSKVSSWRLTRSSMQNLLLQITQRPRLAQRSWSRAKVFMTRDNTARLKRTGMVKS